MKNFLLLILLLTITAAIWGKLGYWLGYQMRSLESYKYIQTAETTQADYYTRYMLKQCLLKQQEL